MFNEAGNVAPIVREVESVLKDMGEHEIICINDGSRDDTLERLRGLERDIPSLRVVTYSTNRGMGYALKQGFKEARGDVIVTIDADGTFSPRDIPFLVEKIGEYDIVIGSPYIKGGTLSGIPFHRKLISKLGNAVLAWSIPFNVRSTTTVFRAYKREVLESIDIESNKMEINPEILAKAGALGFQFKEVPVRLTTRTEGESKFNFLSGAKGHFMLSANEKPFLLFGVMGIILLLIGIISGGYIVKLYFDRALDPNRPLINLTVLFIVSGMIILLFGFVSNQVLQIRRELLRLRRELKVKK
jgi:glycosyltransferase involved in cell wall biosynthesis